MAAEELLPLPSGTTRQSAGVARAFQQRLSWADLEATAAPFGWRLEHASPTIGTVVHGVDCAAVAEGDDAPAVAALRTLFNERGVLFFRNQPFSRRQHLGFARYAEHCARVQTLCRESRDVRVYVRVTRARACVPVRVATAQAVWASARPTPVHAPEFSGRQTSGR